MLDIELFCPIVRKTFVIFLFLLSLVSLNDLRAQLNIKIGYSLGQTLPKVNNNLIKDLNAVRSPLFDDYTEMKGLGFMYGITLGLKYSFDIGSVELAWERLASDRNSVGIDRLPPPQQAISYAYEINYTFNQLMATYESRFGIWGLGTSIGVNRVAVSAPTSNSEQKDRLTTDSQIVTRFSISANFESSNSVAFALKPYFQYPLTKIDLSGVADILNTGTQDPEEGFPIFGLSLIFYNGPQ